MRITKHLYKNFLTNKRVYALNRNYWKRILLEIHKDMSIPLYKEHFSNGQAFYDGNPIISAYLPNLNKSVRIIQEAIEKNTVEIGAWTEKKEASQKPIQELVISLELSLEAAQFAKELINGWFHQNWDTNTIEQAIAKIDNKL